MDNVFIWKCFRSVLLVINFAVDIGVDLVKLDVEQAANAVMVIALFNAAGRILLGKISDRIGRKNTLVIIYALKTALIMFYMSTGLMNYPIYLIAVSFIGFVWWISRPLSFYNGRLLWTKNIGTNYGFMY